MITIYRFENRYDSRKRITISLVRRAKPPVFATHYDWAIDELEGMVSPGEDSSHYTLWSEDDDYVEDF